MIDREMIIAGLESQLDDLSKYADADEVLALTQGQAKEILALLKEKEAQFVLSNRVCETEPFIYVRKGFCPKCHQVVEWYLNRAYCGFCGQAVKWDESD